MNRDPKTRPWMKAVAAAREIQEIANDCRSLLERSGVEATALLRLYHAIDAYADKSI
jgi:hypothetical protein